MKTIVITGSTRGIGFGLATEFLRLGHQVVINGRSEVTLNEALEKLRVISEKVTGVAGNINEPEVHQQLIDKAVAIFGKVDIWINNAGIPQPHRKFIDIEANDIHTLTDINIYGLMLGTKIAAEFMLKQGFGKIFNMEGFGSDGRMMDKLTLYGTSKRAVNYFTKSVSREMEGTCVQVGILSPGMVRTDFLSLKGGERTPAEIKQFDKVYRVLAEDATVVTPFLVNGILASRKHYDRIEFLAGSRLFIRLLKLMLAR